MIAFVVAPTAGIAQDEAAKQSERQSQKVDRPGGADESAQAINEEYNRELVEIERRRLDRLARLAARQNAADAAATYEQLFRLAIAADLFRDAEPAALSVLTGGSPRVMTTALAHMVKIIALADRGQYDQSIESLREAAAERSNAARSGSPRAELATGEIVNICDAYYQRLLQAGQYEHARKALELVLSATQRPALKEFLSSRLSRVQMVGKPAPPLEGMDVDGKMFSLAGAKGKVVLVVFWASWCLPCAAEIESLQQAAESYGRRGFQIVGIDLDAPSDGGQKPETVLPNVRRFLLDYNVAWPTLISGQGEKDYAKAFGVNEIPANVLVGRDGTITHIDLVRKNLDQVIARAVQQ
jgi:thiol-disulfide isomerase/thioredoxin